MKTNRLILSVIITNLLLSTASFAAEPVRTMPGSADVVPARATVTPTGAATDIVTSPSPRAVETMPGATTIKNPSKAVTMMPSTRTARGAEVVLRTSISKSAIAGSNPSPLQKWSYSNYGEPQVKKYEYLWQLVDRAKRAQQKLEEAKSVLRGKESQCMSATRGQLTVRHQRNIGCVSSDSVIACVKKFRAICTANRRSQLDREYARLMLKVGNIRQYLDTQYVLDGH